MTQRTILSVILSFTLIIWPNSVTAGSSSSRQVHDLLCQMFAGQPRSACDPIFKEDKQLAYDIFITTNMVMDSIVLSQIGRWILGKEAHSPSELYDAVIQTVETAVYKAGMTYINKTKSINLPAAQQKLQEIIEEIRVTIQRYPSIEAYNGQAIFGGHLGTSLCRQLARAFNNAQTTAQTQHEPSAPPLVHAEDSAVKCVICFEHFGNNRIPVLLPCRHDQCCADCMQTWLRNGHNTCPLCRYPMTINELQRCIASAFAQQKKRS